MPPPVDRVYTLAREVLDAIITGYAVDGADLPDRRLVTPGQPSWDCAGCYVQAERGFRIEQNLAVEVAEPHLARAGHAMGAVTLAVTVLRCLPVVMSSGTRATLPSTADEEAVAETVLSDPQRIVNLLVAYQREEGFGGCSGLMFEAWQNVGPQGGLVGTTSRLRLTVGI